MKRAINVFIALFIVIGLFSFCYAENAQNKQRTTTQIVCQWMCDSVDRILDLKEKLVRWASTPCRYEQASGAFYYGFLKGLRQGANEKFGAMCGPLSAITSQLVASRKISFAHDWGSLAIRIIELIKTRPDLAYKLYMIVSANSDPQRRKYHNSTCVLSLASEWEFVGSKYEVCRLDVENFILEIFCKRYCLFDPSNEDCPPDRNIMLSLLAAVINGDFKQIDELYKTVIGAEDLLSETFFMKAVTCPCIQERLKPVKAAKPITELTARTYIIPSNPTPKDEDKARLMSAENIVHNYIVIHEALNALQETKPSAEQLKEVNEIMNKSFGKLHTTFMQIFTKRGRQRRAELKGNWSDLIKKTVELIEKNRELGWKLYVLITGLNKAANKHYCAFLLTGSWVLDDLIRNSTDVATKLWVYWATRVLSTWQPYSPPCQVDKLALARIPIAVMNEDVATIEKMYEELITEKNGQVPVEALALFVLQTRGEGGEKRK